MPKKLVTINEAAKYLKLKDHVVSEMIKTGVFNVVKNGKTYKIDKDEIKEWLANLNETEEEQLALRRTVCRFNDYFQQDYIKTGFVSENKYEAIAEMSKFAKDLKIVRDHRWLYEVVVAREELVSTAIGNGVAMLHPRHMHPTKIKKPSILLGRTPEGVEFDAPDNKPVKLMFMLLLHNDKQHLFSLSYLSRFLLNEDNVTALLDAKTEEDIFNVLTDNVMK